MAPLSSAAMLLDSSGIVSALPGWLLGVFGAAGCGAAQAVSMARQARRRTRIFMVAWFSVSGSLCGMGLPEHLVQRCKKRFIFSGSLKCGLPETV